MREVFDTSFQVSYAFRLRFTSDVLRQQPDVLRDVLKGDAKAKVLCVVEERVDAALPWVRPALEHLLAEHADEVSLAQPVLIVPGGEPSKDGSTVVDAVLGAIHRTGLDRMSYVVAIGGGAMLDAVGYAAATAHRGVRLVRLPTTTLSQADSGVGVKNAVNRYGEKNWQGTFAVPWAVINDAALRTGLPDRTFRHGFAEAVKVALLKDAVFFAWLHQHAQALTTRDPERVAFAIRRCALLHLEHITQGGDPFETRTARPLDFGHWSAHRLEALSNFTLPHGDAVAIGLAIDCHYASLTLGLPTADTQRVINTLVALGFPLSHPALDDPAQLLQGLETFRQHLGGALTLTLLSGIGQPVEVHDIDHSAMQEAIQAVRRLAPTCRVS